MSEAKFWFFGVLSSHVQHRPVLGPTFSLFCVYLINEGEHSSGGLPTDGFLHREGGDRDGTQGGDLHRALPVSFMVQKGTGLVSVAHGLNMFSPFLVSPGSPSQLGSAESNTQLDARTAVLPVGYTTAACGTSVRIRIVIHARVKMLSQPTQVTQLSWKTSQ